MVKMFKWSWQVANENWKTWNKLQLKNMKPTLRQVWWISIENYETYFKASMTGLQTAYVRSSFANRQFAGHLKMGGLAWCRCCWHRRRQCRMGTCTAWCARPLPPWSWRTCRGTTSRRGRSRSKTHRGHSFPCTRRTASPRARPRLHCHLPHRPCLPLLGYGALSASP